MPSFILEDLHDGMTKTKFRFYMVPTNTKFNSHITWQDNTMLIRIQSKISDPTYPSPDIYMNRLRPAQKQNPMHDLPFVSIPKNREPEMVV